MNQKEIERVFEVARGCNISQEGDLIVFQNPSALKICKVANQLESEKFSVAIKETKNNTWYGSVKAP